MFQILGNDYLSSSVSAVFFRDFFGNVTFNLTILEDEIAEGPENFTIALTVPDEVAQHVLFVVEEATVTIVDNDGIPII